MAGTNSTPSPHEEHEPDAVLYAEEFAAHGSCCKVCGITPDDAPLKTFEPFFDSDDEDIAGWMCGACRDAWDMAFRVGIERYLKVGAYLAGSFFRHLHERD